MIAENYLQQQQEQEQQQMRVVHEVKHQQITATAEVTAINDRSNSNKKKKLSFSIESILA